MADTKTIVVVGAGFARYWAALAARYAAETWGEQLSIRVINPTDYLTMRPRLYEADPATMTTPLLPLFDIVDVEWVKGWVNHIDPINNRLTLADGTEVVYNSLVLTAGSQFSSPLIEGVKDHAHHIEDLTGAVALDQRLNQLAVEQTPVSAVILGAGFTGIELACEFRSRLTGLGGEVWATNADITLVDTADIVGKTLGKGLDDKLTTALEQWNVRVRLNTSIKKIASDHVLLEDDSRIAANIVVACVGSKANSLTENLKTDMQLELDDSGRLIVDEYLAISESIFSAGDCAHALVDGEHPALMSCQHAVPMGKFAGYNAIAALFNKPPVRYTHQSYITCLDLGPNDALVTRGFERVVEATGKAAKQQKEYINNVLIYPQLDSRENMLATAEPVDRVY